MRRANPASGFTLVEALISIIVIASIGLSLSILFVALVNSTVLTKQRSVANSLAINQIEHLKSLSFDGLAVAGGSIVTTNPIPASFTRTVDGTKYTVTTDISYADDAFDNCGPYPTPALRQKYCRNFQPSVPPPPLDTNPADYKIVHVNVTNAAGTNLARMDTQISATVSETASTTGALFVSVLDPSGEGVGGITVSVKNNLNGVNVSDTTDPNGMAIFYGLPPDNQKRYVIEASASGYSTLTTIAASGSLQPTYPNQSILTQQASSVSLVVDKQRSLSLIAEATDLNGAPLPNTKLYIKGGYKKYTLSSNQDYYYDNFSPTDIRPTTGPDGIATVNNLAPINSYQFCGINGAQGCSVGGTTYYLIAALPYGGTTSLNPITVPSISSSAPTFVYDGGVYAQRVRLILSTNSALPRITSITPDTINVLDNHSNATFTISGSNLAGSVAVLSKDSTIYTHKHCNSNATQLVCGYNLSGITEGEITLTIQNSAGTVTLPVNPLGGIHVRP